MFILYLWKGLCGCKEVWKQCTWKHMQLTTTFLEGQPVLQLGKLCTANELCSPSPWKSTIDGKEKHGWKYHKIPCFFQLFPSMAFLQREQIVEPILVVGSLQHLRFDGIFHSTFLMCRPLPLALFLCHSLLWLCFYDAHCKIGIIAYNQ